MSNLMNHVLMNKLDDELSKAIQEVGGDISGAKGPWDYPEIIKQQLSVRSGSSLPSLDIKLGPGLKMEEVNGEKYILATSGALTTCTLNPPAGSYKQPIYDVIEAGTPIQSVLEALFYEILPKMPSLYKGDVIKASKAGTDQYNEEDLHSGLIPNAVYLRLYVANRQEPVYVLLSGHGLANDEINDPSQPGEHPEYTGGTSQYIQVKVSNGVITASLTDEGLAKFDKIIQLEQSITSIQNDIKVLNENVSNAVSVNELNIVKNKVNEIDNIVKTIEPQITNINSSLKTYEDAIYDIYGKINELKETINNVDLKSIENRLNVTEQNITNLTNEVSKKASVEEVTIIQEKVTTVQENMVTKTEVETIVKTEVQEVVSNDDFVKDVESIIVNQITEEGDVHQAITTVVEKTVGDIPVMSDEEAVEMVDDIFANF